MPLPQKRDRRSSPRARTCGGRKNITKPPRCCGRGWPATRRIFGPGSRWRRTACWRTGRPRPLWLDARDADLRLAQISIGHGLGRTSESLGAAKLYLNGEAVRPRPGMACRGRQGRRPRVGKGSAAQVARLSARPATAQGLAEEIREVAGFAIGGAAGLPAGARGSRLHAAGGCDLPTRPRPPQHWAMLRLTPLRTACLLACYLFSPRLPAQDNPAYRTPSAALTALVDAPLTPAVSLSPDRQRLLLLERSSWPPVAELAEPEVRLAGLRINPATNSPSRESYFTGLVVKSLADDPGKRVSGFPSGARLTSPAWARNGRHVLVVLTHPNGQELWVVDAGMATARRVTERALNGVMASPAWVDDSTIAVTLVPAGRGTIPAAPTVPSGPVVQENLGVNARPAPIPTCWRARTMRRFSNTSPRRNSRWSRSTAGSRRSGCAHWWETWRRRPTANTSS